MVEVCTSYYYRLDLQLAQVPGVGAPWASRMFEQQRPWHRQACGRQPVYFVHPYTCYLYIHINLSLQPIYTTPVCVCLCVCIYIYIYILTHVGMYTQVHAVIPSPESFSRPKPPQKCSVRTTGARGQAQDSLRQLLYKLA